MSLLYPALPLETSTTLPPPDAPAAPQERAKLSTQLDVMAAELQDRPISFGEVIVTTQGRAYDLLLVLLAVPFLSPIGSIPFVAASVGALMMLIGFRLAMGQKPWLPEKVLARRLNSGVVLKIIKAGAALMRRLEKLLRPRLGFVYHSATLQRLTGALIVLSGFLLFLPIPIPLSNFLPAFTVLLLAAGALERDGAFFLAGCAMFLLTCAFFAAIALGGMEALAWVRDLLPDWGNEQEAELLQELPVVP